MGRSIEHLLKRDWEGHSAAYDIRRNHRDNATAIYRDGDVVVSFVYDGRDNMAGDVVALSQANATFTQPKGWRDHANPLEKFPRAEIDPGGEFTEPPPEAGANEWKMRDWQKRHDAFYTLVLYRKFDGPNHTFCSRVERTRVTL